MCVRGHSNGEGQQSLHTHTHTAQFMVQPPDEKHLSPLFAGKIRNEKNKQTPNLARKGNESQTDF